MVNVFIQSLNQLWKQWCYPFYGATASFNSYASICTARKPITMRQTITLGNKMIINVLQHTDCGVCCVLKVTVMVQKGCPWPLLLKFLYDLQEANSYVPLCSNRILNFWCNGDKMNIWWGCTHHHPLYIFFDGSIVCENPNSCPAFYFGIRLIILSSLSMPMSVVSKVWETDSRMADKGRLRAFLPSV
jgi:hypothetical protein